MSFVRFYCDKTKLTSSISEMSSYISFYNRAKSNYFALSIVTEEQHLDEPSKTANKMN